MIRWTCLLIQDPFGAVWLVHTPAGLTTAEGIQAGQAGRRVEWYPRTKEDPR